MNPIRLQGIRLADGTVAGANLPSLAEREPLPAWREAIEGRQLPLLVVSPPPQGLRGVPFAHLKRLAGLVPVWSDASPEDPEDVLDLTMSGPTRILLWWRHIKDDMDAWLDGLYGTGLLGVDAGDEADVDAILAAAANFDLDLVLRGSAEAIAADVPADDHAVFAWREEEGPWGLGLEVLASRPKAEEEDEAEAEAMPAVPEAPRAIL